MSLMKWVTRVLALLGKELREIRRRPGAIVSLILGPFLIMAIFGIGFNGFRRPLATILVLPPDTGLSQQASDYQELAGSGFLIDAVTGDATAAEARLRAQEVDLVVLAPDDMLGRFLSGQQSVIRIEYNSIDPVAVAYAQNLASSLSAEVNRTLIENAAGAGEHVVLDVAPGATLVPAAVIAQPTRVDTSNLAPSSPTVVTFFGPAVVALILQHMAVTLSAMSLVRERLSGVMEVFRISPVGALEILLGKYLAFGILNGVIAAAVLGLMVRVLGVPLLGDPVQLAGVIALLVISSLALGLFISVVSDSERQAVQLSLMALLASVFFSGFVLSIDQFIPAVRSAAYALPVTHGIRLMQDLMLRGSTTAGWEVGALGGIAAVLFCLTWFLLRRDMVHA